MAPRGGKRLLIANFDLVHSDVLDAIQVAAQFTAKGAPEHQIAWRYALARPQVPPYVRGTRAARKHENLFSWLKDGSLPEPLFTGILEDRLPQLSAFFDTFCGGSKQYRSFSKALQEYGESLYRKANVTADDWIVLVGGGCYLQELCRLSYLFAVAALIHKNPVYRLICNEDEEYEFAQVVGLDQLSSR